MTHKFIALLAIMLTLGVVNAHGVAIASPLVGRMPPHPLLPPAPSDVLFQLISEMMD